MYAIWELYDVRPGMYIAFAIECIYVAMATTLLTTSKFAYYFSCMGNYSCAAVTPDVLLLLCVQALSQTKPICPAKPEHENCFCFHERG